MYNGKALFNLRTGGQKTMIYFFKCSRSLQIMFATAQLSHGKIFSGFHSIPRDLVFLCW